MRITLGIILTFFLGWNAFSQYYSTGQDPASIRWRQIKTEKYQLIFPAPFEKKAQYLANVMDLVVSGEISSLKAQVPRIPVILHTQSAISNGLTVWAPKRIELYPCPPQQTYAEEWLEQLAIHEYRHAVQISSINKGFSKAMGYVFGEQITGGILGLFVPSWFLEGDATVAETALSNTGRGRSALFESTLRAQVVEKGIYSYDKVTLGSYKTFTPDAYQLGYFLVGQVRNKYGIQAWDEAINRVAKYPFMVVPFNSGIRKTTGKWKTQIYKEALMELDSAWKRQLHATNHPAYHHITKRNPKNYTEYSHPIMINDTTILADKSSMDDITRFVLIDRKTGHEKKLLTPGYHVGGTTSVGGNYLAWSELEPDHRWQNRDYAEIRIYNFLTGKQEELTSQSRYFAPIISHDGSRCAAVNITENNQCNIDILEVPSGRLLKQFPIPDFGQAITPNWSPDLSKIIFTLLTEKGETIAILDTTTGIISNLLPFSFNEFNGPAFFYSHYVIFSVDHSGAENIYAMDTLNHHIFKVTSGRFATFDPDFTSDKKYMICSDYCSDGMMVAQIRMDSSTWIPLRRVNNHAFRLFDKLAAQEKFNIQDTVLARKIFKLNHRDDAELSRDSISGKIYPTQKYSKAGHLFNPHSWAPVSLDAGNLNFKPGVMVLSQNALSSMFANAGWEYDLNEETGKFYAGLSYQGLYPVFDLDFSIGNRAGWAHYDSSSQNFRFTWQETKLKFQVGIPWNFSHGRFSRYLTPSIGTSLTAVRHNASTPEPFTSGLIQTLDYRIFGAMYLQSSDKDIYPRFGHSLELNYRHSPFSRNNMGTIFAAEANLYFPGIVRHHGIWLYAGYQQADKGDVMAYGYSNFLRPPRGYLGIDYPKMVSLQFNYMFPIIYPDFSAGSVLYLKRVKMNLFYDLNLGYESGDRFTDQSTGAELTADFHLLRFFAPIEMGIRAIYFPGAVGWGWEFLYSIGI